MIRRTTTFRSETKNSTLFVHESSPENVGLVFELSAFRPFELSEVDEEELYDLLLERRLARSESKS